MDFISIWFCSPIFLLCVGIVLICLELVLSEFFFLWIGLGFLQTSVTVFIIDLLKSKLEIPVWMTNLGFIVIIFTFYVMIMLYVGHQRYKNKGLINESKGVNNKLQNLLGEIVVLHKNSDDLDCDGYIVVHDTRWRVKSLTTLNQNSKVRIIGFENNLVMVEPA